MEKSFLIILVSLIFNLQALGRELKGWAPPAIIRGDWKLDEERLDLPPEERPKRNYYYYNCFLQPYTKRSFRPMHLSHLGLLKEITIRFTFTGNMELCPPGPTTLEMHLEGQDRLFDYKGDEIKIQVLEPIVSKEKRDFHLSQGSWKRHEYPDTGDITLDITDPYPEITYNKKFHPQCASSVSAEQCYEPNSLQKEAAFTQRLIKESDEKITLTQELISLLDYTDEMLTQKIQDLELKIAELEDEIDPDSKALKEKLQSTKDSLKEIERLDVEERAKKREEAFDKQVEIQNENGKLKETLSLLLNEMEDPKCSH